ncbi:Hsp20/alpha crystallin family protein [Cognatilysobacter bugurensis]|uniref:Heat-shock protein n=1 Tax=Cognatilysobacter bugurensis TaxID=543356 RepID=A0A918STY1_9GAMM|nr:Hsp20/alpha crystallin family protein [Lysobacter bugurensis]GHA71536.1 heat-shock protein [Lysobacter bugurensis]
MNLNRFPQQHRSGQAPMPEEFKQLFERFFQMNEGGDESSVVTSQWAPRVDVREDANRFVILADLPGIDPAEVEIWMDKGILSIKGERKSEVTEQNERYSRIERRYGSFHRRFALPDSADPEGVTADGRHGVLEISIPKRPETTPRRIHVGGAGQRDGNGGGDGQSTRQ